MTLNSFKNYATILIITIILSVISLFSLGIIGFIFTALLSAVVGYTVIKYHYLFVSTVCACAVAVFAIFTDNFIFAVSSVIPSLLCGISLGVAYNIKLNEFKTLSVLSSIYALYMLLSIKILGVNENNHNIIEESFYTSAKVYKDALFAAYGGTISKVDIDVLMADALSVMMRFMPCIIIILCISIALFIFYVFKKVLKTRKVDLSQYKVFSDWQADKSLGIIHLIITLMCLILPANYFTDTLMNVVVISSFIFFILGLSFIDFILKCRAKNSMLRKIFLFFITIFSLLSLGVPFIAVSLMGTFETLFKLKEKTAKK